MVIEREEQGQIVVRNGGMVVLECAAEPLTLSLLHTEGLFGARVNMEEWTEERDPAFRFGVGVMRKGAGGRAKGNFTGSGFTLSSPRGLSVGTVEVLLDDTKFDTPDLRSVTPEKSSPLLARTNLPPGRHAVVLRALEGNLVVDTLDVIYRQMSSISVSM